LSGPPAHFLFLVVDMQQSNPRLRQLFGPVVESMGYELVGVEFQPRPPNALLRIYIDKESGINLADCEQVSHQISGILDVEDPIPGHYRLEVSSPGLDRPLFEAAHYMRFAGHEVKLQLHININGKKKFTGRLRGVENQEVVLDCDGEELRVPLEQIDKARLVPEPWPGTSERRAP